MPRVEAAEKPVILMPKSAPATDVQGDQLNHVQQYGRALKTWHVLNATLPPIISGVVVIVAWEIAVRILEMPEYLLPAPSRIAEVFATDYRSLFTQLGATALASALGFAVSLVAAAALSVLFVLFRVIDRAVYPWVVLSHAVPKVAIAPLFLVWLGYGLTNKTLFVALMCVFPMLVAMVTGLKSAEPELIQLVRSMGASTAQVFWRIRVPNALPIAFTGIKVAVTLAPVAAVVSEFVASNNGIGYLLVGSISNLQVAKAFAAVTLVSIFGIAIWYAVGFVESQMCRWHASQRPSGS